MKKKGMLHYKNSPNEPEALEMLQHSNWIEGEDSSAAMDDAIVAWQYAVRNNRDFTTKYVLKIHKLMQRNLRPEIAGKFRKCDVYIGGECRKYISNEILVAAVKDSIRFFSETKKDKLLPLAEREELAKRAHVEFEKVHPFEDGNGRVGRILYNIHRLRIDLPLHIIHKGEEQLEYYKWFK